MNKLIPLLSFCLVSFMANAQPKLTSDKMLPAGSLMRFQYVQNYNLIDTTAQGANKTWNFSSLTNTLDSDLYVTIATPAQTGHGSLFPSANYAYISYQSPTLEYDYFNLTTTKMERVGSWSSSSVTTYTDPQIEYVFPLQLGDTSIDTWANSSSSFGGNYNLFCVGYGTLIVPNATYTNALMVRVDVSEGDLFSIPVYFWYSADNGAILFEYIVGDGFFVSQQAMYTKILTVGIGEQEFVYNVRYNNPVRDLCNLSFTCSKPAKLECTVMNSMGEIVLTQNYITAGHRAELIEMNFSGLAQGIYFVTIRSEDPGEIARTYKIMKM